MLSFAFSAIIIILCITIVFMLLRFFKSQLKTSYKMVSKFQEEAEQLILEKRRLEAHVDELYKKIKEEEKQQKTQLKNPAKPPLWNVLRRNY